MMILVTGGAGYIGSHTCVELLNAGHEVVVADNLANASEEALRRVKEITGKDLRFIKADLCDVAATRQVFDENPGIAAVIHFAALKAVGESVQKPLEYYTNNLVCLLNVLGAMREHGVKNIVFSSSATVYGDPDSVPVGEDAPTKPATNPYGVTKQFAEKILTDLCAADTSLNVALLRYFNPIGAHKSGRIGEDPKGVPRNIVPIIAQVAAGRLPEFLITGDDYDTPDGTGVRDYIHVVDLAKGHVAALAKLATGCGLFVCNLGTGKGYSVLQVLAAYEKACGKKIPRRFAPRRPGDVAIVCANPALALRELGWQAQYGIDDMCADSWNWQKNNPDGYR